MSATILHVEDDPSQRRLLRSYLEYNPEWQILESSDGDDALQRIRRDKPDLVISDIRMPNMSGIELCSSLRADSRYSDVPFLMLTQYSDTETVMQSLEAGADNFLEKPYDQETLSLRIEELLSEKTSLKAPSAGVNAEGSKEISRMLNFFKAAYSSTIHAREGLVRANEILEQRVAERTVSLQKLTDEAHKSAAELEQVNYLISHHFQDPLLRMVGFFELIEKQCRGKAGSSTERAFRELKSGMLKLQTLVSDLLLYSERNEGELPVVEASLEELVQEVLNSDLAQDVQILNPQIEIKTLPRIKVNPWQMKQVFFNLLHNALRFHGAKRPSIKVSADELSDEWRVAVEDNGVGINPAFFESIFEISPRMHSSTSFVGTGVGLAICRKIVARHGGQIWVTSTEGRGSTFHFTLSKELGVPRKNGAHKPSSSFHA